jgi:hypothetical protein
MGKHLLSAFLLCLFLLTGQICYSQDSSSIYNKILNFPDKLLNSVQKKAYVFESRLDLQAEKYLARMEKREEKLFRKMYKIDSTKARILQTESKEKYSQLAQRIKTGVEAPIGIVTGGYLPYMDSLKGSLTVLKQSQNLITQSGQITQKLNSSFDQVKLLEAKLQQAEQVKQFIRERKEQIRQVLSRYTKLPQSLLRQVKGINKEVYYYAQQIRDYREMISHPEKVERKAFSVLSKTKPFQEFMRKNSMLASLFRLPVDAPNDPAYLQSLAGLQTRAQVNQLVQNQLTLGGPSGSQQISSGLQQAQSQLQTLKDKVSRWGGGGSDMEMPEGFRPQNLKTKTFLQRIVLGTDVQTQRSTSLLPASSDLGISAGYRLNNNNSLIGVGFSYKMGWGQNIQNIHISSQGAGLRSFIDWKLKGSLWVSGGFEMNYRSIFNSLDQLRELNAWQQSGLLGVSKKFNVQMKFFKNTKVQVLWDFLSYRQVPRTQPILFRVGYGF